MKMDQVEKELQGLSLHVEKEESEEGEEEEEDPRKSVPKKTSFDYARQKRELEELISKYAGIITQEQIDAERHFLEEKKRMMENEQPESIHMLTIRAFYMKNLPTNDKEEHDRLRKLWMVANLLASPLFRPRTEKTAAVLAKEMAKLTEEDRKDLCARYDQASKEYYQAREEWKQRKLAWDTDHHQYSVLAKKHLRTRKILSHAYVKRKEECKYGEMINVFLTGKKRDSQVYELPLRIYSPVSRQRGIVNVFFWKNDVLMAQTTKDIFQQDANDTEVIGREAVVVGTSRVLGRIVKVSGPYVILTVDEWIQHERKFQQCGTWEDVLSEWGVFQVSSQPTDLCVNDMTFGKS